MTIFTDKPVTIDEALKISEEMTKGDKQYFENKYIGKTDEELSKIAEWSPFEHCLIEDFLRRKLNDTRYWDFPEYQYEGQDEDLRLDRETRNDENLIALGWEKENDHTFSKKTFHKETNVRIFVEMFPENNNIHFWTTNGVIDLYLTWDEMYNLLQIARERYFEKPVFKNNYFIRVEKQGFWEVPDFRYYNMGMVEESKRKAGGEMGLLSPYELIFTRLDNWEISKDNRNEYIKKVGNNKFLIAVVTAYPTINSLSDAKDGILLYNDGYNYGIPFNEFVALFQKCRELEFKKPDTWRTYEKSYPDKGGILVARIWWENI